MFLHMRDATDDFLATITANRSRIPGGVVHSFDGSLDAANALVRCPWRGLFFFLSFPRPSTCKCARPPSCPHPRASALQIDQGFYLGLNGCSLKTEENLAVVKELPLDRLMLEVGSPAPL